MTTQPETRIQQAIQAELQRRGAFCFKVHGSAFQAKGLPDIVGCIDGRFFGIEVKVPGRDAEPIQRLQLRRIIEAGGIAGVAHSVAEAVDIIEGAQ